MTVFDFSALSGWTHCLSYVLFLVHALQFYFYYLTETTMCPKHFNICYLTCFSKSLQEVVIITPTLAGKSEKQPCQFAAGLRLTLVLLTPTPGSSLDRSEGVEGYVYQLCPQQQLLLKEGLSCSPPLPPQGLYRLSHQ